MSATAATTVGFIGLGNMGGPMARNLAAAGYHLQVADLDPEKVQAVITAGGNVTGVADSAAAASGADVVFTSLPGPKQVRAVGTELLSVMAPGSVWIDLSTNDLTCASELAQQASTTGVRLLDAPVTGGAEGAEDGTLVVLVGGEPQTFASCLPVLNAIGSRIEHLGPRGAGYVAKITQVTLCYLNSVTLTEALLLGVKGGVAPDKMLDIIRGSTGRSYVADQYGPEILNGGYDNTFDLGLAAKDMRLAMDLAADVGATLPFMQLVTDYYKEAEAVFGFDAPHLQAVQLSEQENALILHQVTETGWSTLADQDV